MAKNMIGQHVQISQGSGLDSGKTGVVVNRQVIPTDGRGIPKIPGAYYPMKAEEVAIQEDNTGELIIMFQYCLI